MSRLVQVVRMKVDLWSVPVSNSEFQDVVILLFSAKFIEASGAVTSKLPVRLLVKVRVSRSGRYGSGRGSDDDGGVVKLPWWGRLDIVCHR